MRISTRGRYALRMMLDIAINSKGAPVRFKDVSSRQDISLKYLENIGALLVRAGLLRGVRGMQGGYLLTKPASEITVGSILRVTEGPMGPVPCIDDVGSCERQPECLTHPLWVRLDRAIAEVLDGTTLQDLVDEGRGKGIVPIDAGSES